MSSSSFIPSLPVAMISTVGREDSYSKPGQRTTDPLSELNESTCKASPSHPPFSETCRAETTQGLSGDEETRALQSLRLASSPNTSFMAFENNEDARMQSLHAAAISGLFAPRLSTQTGFSKCLPRRVYILPNALR
ncbi:unnamed protein product [Pleuronectes platessa]|uniref:Uncharacterized protein n=1 Tax=Pleuronectes platessa TaxID=8262 RepID=A0A9N7Z0I3_PLEPL|nr:unnamed protein product [Pleuronectes platessa]